MLLSTSMLNQAVTHTGAKQAKASRKLHPRPCCPTWLTHRPPYLCMTPSWWQCAATVTMVRK